MGLNVIMMGPPGAGKGTQAGRFARERGLLKISTGDILREAIKEKNPTALAAQARMDRGELVDDETIIAIVADRLGRADARRGFVLDGFPRTVAQARALDELVARMDSGPLIVIDVAARLPVLATAMQYSTTAPGISLGSVVPLIGSDTTRLRLVTVSVAVCTI